MNIICCINKYLISQDKYKTWNWSWEDNEEVLFHFTFPIFCWETYTRKSVAKHIHTKNFLIVWKINFWRWKSLEDDCWKWKRRFKICLSSIIILIAQTNCFCKFLQCKRQGKICADIKLKKNVAMRNNWN